MKGKNLNIPAYNHLETALSDKCCLTCGFCYTKGGACNEYDAVRVKKTLDWFFTQYQKKIENKTYNERKVHISFFGGEPIAEWPHLQEVIEFTSSLSKTLGITTTYTAVSNLALLNEERINWLYAHQCGISCSVDGCEEAEDYWRKYPDGTGASKDVFPNAKYLTSHGLSSTVRMTITPETVQWMFKSVKFLAEEIGFTTINCVPAAVVNWDEKAIQTYSEELIKTTDWWIDCVRKGIWKPLYYLNKKLPLVWGIPDNHLACGAGLSMIYVDTNSKIWPCHRFSSFVSKEKYCLGDIDNGITNIDFIERLREANYRHIFFYDKCKTCQEKYACNLYCLNEMSEYHDKLPPHTCHLGHIMLRESRRVHEILIKENNPLYKTHFDKKQTGTISTSKPHKMKCDDINAADAPFIIE